MITKAIIPAAGLGTRFLPASKAVPKEMLPILDKPAIQYVVEEAIQAGIRDFVIVTSSGKQAIEEHFSTNASLEYHLASKNRPLALQGVGTVLKSASFTYVYQDEQLGLGHAVWFVRRPVSDELVAVLLPDDIIAGKMSGIGQLMKVAQQERCNVVAVQEVAPEDVSRYGIVGVKKQFSPNLFQVRELVEKPAKDKAPSNLAIVGRYVLSSDIFEALGDSDAGAIGEIQLTDAIQRLHYNGEKVFALKMQGDRYDVGTPVGWLNANVSLALKHPQYGEQVMKHLNEIDAEMLMIEGRADALRKMREL